jgi:hypothetical protein
MGRGKSAIIGVEENALMARLEIAWNGLSEADRELVPPEEHWELGCRKSVTGQFLSLYPRAQVTPDIGVQFI